MLFQLDSFPRAPYSRSSAGINSLLIFVLASVYSKHFWSRLLLKWPSTIAAAVRRKVEKVTSVLVCRERNSQTVASSLLLLLLGVSGDGF